MSMKLREPAVVGAPEPTPPPFHDVVVDIRTGSPTGGAVDVVRPDVFGPAAEQALLPSYAACTAHTSRMAP